MRIGKSAFISYRGSNVGAAKALAQDMIDNEICDTVVFIPPGHICLDNELLLPYEYFELMENILDAYYNCQAFVIVEDDTYWQSYWTQMEVLQWRRFSKDQTIYIAKGDEDSIGIIGSGTLPPLSRQEAKLLAKISVGTNRRMVESSKMATFWGRYARSCFVVPCNGCKCHFLASQKAIYATLSADSSIGCPYCSNPVAFREAKHWGSFKRKPVTLAEPVRQIPMLDDQTMTGLLVSNDLPAGIQVVTLPGEKLKTDGRKVAEMYGWMALGLIVVGAAASLYDAVKGEGSGADS